MPTLRTALLDETGVPCPTLRFVEDDNLPPSSFSFRIQSLTTPPRLGPTVDERFVTRAPSDLHGDGVVATLAVDPRTHAPAGIIPNEDVWSVPEGAHVMDSFGFLVYSLVSALRDRAPRLLDTRVVDGIMERMKRSGPRLLAEVGQRVGISLLTYLLRQLVTEGISVRNLPVVLEGVLDREYADTPLLSLMVLNDFPAEQTGDSAEIAISCLRKRLKQLVTLQHTGVSRTLIVYSVDDTLLTPGSHDRLIDAVADEIPFVRSGGSAVLLVEPEWRARTKTALADELPSVAVLAYDEVPDDVTVIEFARIAAS
jgi:type III secretion protein V